MRDDPIYLALDSLCAKLWGVDKKGLKAVQDAYREMYVSVGKAPTGD